MTKTEYETLNERLFIYETLRDQKEEYTKAMQKSKELKKMSLDNIGRESGMIIRDICKNDKDFTASLHECINTFCMEKIKSIDKEIHRL